MTEEKAIEMLKKDKEQRGDCFISDAIDMAISDMEKQIPKKPKPINWEQYVGIVRNAKYLRNRFWCPNCGTDINSGHYCSTCGQLLDWSDEE